MLCIKFGRCSERLLGFYKIIYTFPNLPPQKKLPPKETIPPLTTVKLTTKFPYP